MANYHDPEAFVNFGLGIGGLGSIHNVNFSYDVRFSSSGSKMVEKSGVERLMVEKSGLEKSGVEA